jgi:hypothetical protein
MVRVMIFVCRSRGAKNVATDSETSQKALLGFGAAALISRARTSFVGACCDNHLVLTLVFSVVTFFFRSFISFLPRFRVVRLRASTKRVLTP